MSKKPSRNLIKFSKTLLQHSISTRRASRRTGAFANGTLTVARRCGAESKRLHTIRLEFSKVLGIPESKIRLVSKWVGGAFGSKNELEPFMIICAHLSKSLGHPSA